MKFITSRALVLGIQAVVSAVLAFFVVKIGILPTKYLMAKIRSISSIMAIDVLIIKAIKEEKSCKTFNW